MSGYVGKQRAAVVFRLFPLTGHPPFDEHALQSWIEGTLFDLQNVVGYLVNVLLLIP